MLDVNKSDLKVKKTGSERKAKYLTDYSLSVNNNTMPGVDLDLERGFHWWHAQYLVSPYVVPDVQALSKEEEIWLLQKHAKHFTTVLKDIKNRLSTLKNEDTDEIPAFIPDCVNGP